MSHLAVRRDASEEALAKSFSVRLKLPYVRLASIELDADALSLVSHVVLRRHACLPIRFDGRKLVVAMSNPLDLRAIADLQFAASRPVNPVVACRSEILTEIERHFPAAAAEPDRLRPRDIVSLTSIEGSDGAWDLDQIDLREAPENAPVVHLCREIMLHAVEAGASDVHIEPGPGDVRVRLRLDGVLRDYVRVPRWIHQALVSRVKVLASLDIAQQRVPQDGRLRVRAHRRMADVRVSTLPTQFGEKAVLRLLGSTHVPTLAALGLSDDEQQVLADALHQPQGLILVTGPTGSGKSTTLHAMLRGRSSPGVNIVTIEDPIEYQLPDAAQVQVDPRAGLTFAGCLRAVLRQDPDVILLGEIRDSETADVAYQASLTGHLVLTTLHTNSAIAAIDRLLDLGVRPSAITSATNVIVAQRLARRICVHCRGPYLPASAALRRLRIDATQHVLLRGSGCTHCGYTGYLGRVGIFEILRLNAELKKMITHRASEADLRRAAAHRWLLDDAAQKVRGGLTTVEEVLRVVRIDDEDEISSRSVSSRIG
jgi:type IV pilus assembly protein PilB